MATATILRPIDSKRLVKIAAQLSALARELSSDGLPRQRRRARRPAPVAKIPTVKPTKAAKSTTKRNPLTATPDE